MRLVYINYVTQKKKKTCVRVQCLSHAVQKNPSNLCVSYYHTILVAKFESKLCLVFEGGKKKKMQSLLNIKVFTDFNTGPGTRRLVVGRGSCGGGLFGESEVGVIRRQHQRQRQQWFNSRYSSKNSRILACANNGNGNGPGQTPSSTPSPIPSSSSSSSSSSFFSRSQTYALLKQRLEVAAKSEVHNTV